MARTRRSAGAEAGAARGHVVSGVLDGAYAAALWIAVTRFLPDDWSWPSDGDRDRILLFGVGGLAALGAFRWGVAVFHGLRWAGARRWERMLADPSTAHLVPPLRDHVKSVTRASELRLRLTAVVATLASIGLVVAARRYDLSDGSGDESGPVIAAGLFGWVAVKSWRTAGRRRIARRIEAVSSAGVAHDDGPSMGAVSVTIPALHVNFAVRGEAAAVRPKQVMTAYGEPRHILYLRLFDNESGTARLLSGSWPRRGYVHLLRSADQVTPDEIDAAKDAGSIESMFISSPAELEDALARQATGRYDPPPPSGIRARWRWIHDPQRGTYPVRALLCHGSFWKQALDLLLPRMDHVVLDLTGYRPERAGTRYEMQRLIDTYPIDGVSIISDGHCDRAFLAAQLTWAWRHMAPGSPNEGPAARTVTVRLPTPARAA